jgi:hypothetical protein
MHGHGLTGTTWATGTDGTDAAEEGTDADAGAVWPVMIA